MLELKVETDALLKQVNAMLGKLRHFRNVDIGAELSEWQVEDMHRHRPFTMRARTKGTATTVIRPHSLYEMLKSEGVRLSERELRHVRRGLGKHLRHPLKRRSRMILREHRHWSSRPILRTELFERLGPRYADRLIEKLTW